MWHQDCQKILYFSYVTVFIVFSVRCLYPIKINAEWAEQLSKHTLSAQNVDIPDAGPASAAAEAAATAATIKPAYPGNDLSY